MPVPLLLDGAHSFAPRSVVSTDAIFGPMDPMHLGKHRAALTSMAQRRNDLGAFTSVNSAGVLTMHQRWIIQVLCACMASMSITAAICAIYWFFMMRRNYRRDLVLMLILGDFYKSLWYLIYGIVNFVQEQVRSSNPFCQVTGFMIQTGLAACGKSLQVHSGTILTTYQTLPSCSSACTWRYRFSRRRIQSWVTMACTESGDTCSQHGY